MREGADIKFPHLHANERLYPPIAYWLYPPYLVLEKKKKNIRADNYQRRFTMKRRISDCWEL